MPHLNVTAETGLSSQRVIGWLIRDGYEITIVANAPRPVGAAGL